MKLAILINKDSIEGFINPQSLYFIVIEKECTICGKKYSVFKCRENSLFCSNKCKYQGEIYKEVAYKLHKFNKGKHCHTEEHKQKLRERMLKDNPSKRPEIKEKISQQIKWMFENDEEYIKKCKETNYLKSMPLDKNPNWKNGATDKWRKFRAHISSKLATWTREVKKKDNYICQECGCNERAILEAHHIKPVRDYPELVLDVSNGITLCSICHMEKTKQMLKNKNKGRLSYEQ
jgi:5-methylcytosine-specific restriction endonuclease McrA